MTLITEPGAQCEERAAAVKRPRRMRSRPLPRWLVNSSAQIDAIARSRVLLVLSVLSGETPVTRAIEQAKCSRGTYYHWESRAVKAMLAALNPVASSAADGSADLSAATARIEQLQARVERLEREKRRGARLLLLTQKTIRGTTLNLARRGRRPKARTTTSATPGTTKSRGASSP